MMRSSCTGMKEDHYNAVIRSRIIRRLRVQDLRCLWVQDSVLHLERKARYISGIVYKCSLARTTLRGGNRCGRSTMAADAPALAARLQAYVPPGLLAPSSNAAPAQGLPTLVHAHPSLITVSAWGFRPAWSDWRDVPPVIHARAETVASKPDVRGSSRQGCASNGVQVPIPSIARFRRLAYPGHGEVTNRERLGRRNHGCP